MMDVSLAPWPVPGTGELQDLYEHTDQKYCLTILPVPLPEQSTVQYLNAVHTGMAGQRRLYIRAVMLGNQIIGKIELSAEGEESELDIILRKEFTGRGYGLQAFRQLLQEVQHTGFCTYITAYVHKENIHARRMLAKAGMRQTRPFSADVLVPDNGMYRLKAVEGYEYILYLEETEPHH